MKTKKTPGELGCIDFVAGGWKLQLPVESDTKPGSVLENRHRNWRTATPVSFSLRLLTKTDKTRWCSTARYRDSNRKHHLCPFRDAGMLDPKDKTVNWTWQGTHTLVAEQKVTHVPANDKVITSQIHGIEQNGDNANPLVKVLYAYDKAKGNGNPRACLSRATSGAPRR